MKYKNPYSIMATSKNHAWMKCLTIFSSGETKSAVNTLCIREHFCKIWREGRQAFRRGKINAGAAFRILNTGYKIWLALIPALLLAAVLAGCGEVKGGEPASPAQAQSSEAPDTEPEEPEDPEYPVTYGAYTVKARPGRVISLAPAITEKLYDLGFESRLAGISKYCDYPESAVVLPSYGTAQLPDMDEILDAAPHLVLCAAELSAENKAILRDAGIGVVVLPSYHGSLEELKETYLAISAIMEGRTTGKEIGGRFVSEMEAKIDEIAAMPAEGEPKIALYLRRLDFTIATGDTLEGELMERIGFVNMASGRSGWTIDSEYANSEKGREEFRAIDIMFFDERDVTIKMLEQSAFYKGLNAVLKDYYIYIDCTAFERQSLRMLDELRLMAEQK